MRLCAGRGCGASLFVLGGRGVGAEGLLRGAQSPVSAGQEFPGADAVASAILFTRSLLLACTVQPAGAGRSSSVSTLTRRLRRKHARSAAPRLAGASGHATKPRPSPE